MLQKKTLKYKSFHKELEIKKSLHTTMSLHYKLFIENIVVRSGILSV